MDANTGGAAFPDSLIDKVAEAIRNDGGHYDEAAWDDLPDDRKIGWRGDAKRALAVVKDYLTTEPVSVPYKSEPSGNSREFAVVEVVSGVEGPSLYIDDFRVAGRKPWGGGSTIHKFKAPLSDIRKALARGNR